MIYISLLHVRVRRYRCYTYVDTANCHLAPPDAAAVISWRGESAGKCTASRSILALGDCCPRGVAGGPGATAERTSASFAAACARAATSGELPGVLYASCGGPERQPPPAPAGEAPAPCGTALSTCRRPASVCRHFSSAFSARAANLAARSCARAFSAAAILARSSSTACEARARVLLCASARERGTDG